MIRLERFNINDCERLISWVDSEEALMQFAGPAFSFPLTREQLDLSVNTPNRYTFKVVATETNSVIGHAEIHLRETTAYLARILIGDKDQRGKGIGQQIIHELLKFTFQNLNQTEVALNVYDWNTAAIKCYDKVGFTINTDRTSESTVNGQTWVALNMVIHKDEWKL